MNIALAVAFIAFAVALTAVWAASEVSKKTMAKATSLVRDHATEMIKLVSSNDHAVAGLKETIIELKLENKTLKQEIVKEAERRSRDVEQINEHFEDLESGWSGKKNHNFNQ